MSGRGERPVAPVVAWMHALPRLSAYASNQPGLRRPKWVCPTSDSWHDAGRPTHAPSGRVPRNAFRFLEPGPGPGLTGPGRMPSVDRSASAPGRPSPETPGAPAQASPPAPVIAFVLKGYPRLSETFITQEILAVEARGLRLHLVSLRHPTEASVHPVHARVRAPVNYLPEYLHEEPGRVFRAWRRVRRFPGYGRTLRLWLRDLMRDPTRNRVRRFGQAVVMADELPPEVTHIHAHFLHTPASVARYAAHLTGRKWTGSAHAKDIWTTPRWEKREKLHDAQWVVTCTAVNLAELGALAPGRVELVRHGLDFDEFPPAPAPAPAPEAAEGKERGEGEEDAEGEPPVLTILSVGRAVEKKGYPDLIAALARMPESPAWRFVHVGGGPLIAQLRELAERAGIADRTQWAGAIARPELLARLRAADLFVLASRVARDGDRDGLPNVLLEAQSQGLPCVATRVSAIPELIEDGVTGLLCPSGDPDALAAALERLLRDRSLRRRLGAAGERRVRSEFSSVTGADRLVEKFRELLGMEAPGGGIAPVAADAGDLSDDRSVATGSNTEDRAA